jgi:hypothetical protein
MLAIAPGNTGWRTYAGRMIDGRTAFRTVGTPVPAGTSVPRKEVRAIELTVVMVLLLVILWITRK